MTNGQLDNRKMTLSWTIGQHNRADDGDSGTDDTIGVSKKYIVSYSKQ